MNLIHCFASLGTKISNTFKNDPMKWKNPECIYKFKLEYLSEDNILKHLLSLQENNPDVLTFDAKLLRISANVIYKSLTKLINMSISTGQIPEDWNLSRITPMYKGNSCHTTMGNYRPMSVISHIAKIMEQKVYK